MKIDFYLRFHTKFGQTLAIYGNLPSLGLNEPNKALPLITLSSSCFSSASLSASHAPISLHPSQLLQHDLHPELLIGNDLLQLTLAIFAPGPGELVGEFLDLLQEADLLGNIA